MVRTTRSPPWAPPGTITPAALTISATSDAKVYDGTTTSSKTPTYGALRGSDTLTGLTQAFDSENVLGTKGSELTVTGYTVNDDNGGKNYTVTTQDAPGTIAPAALTITATGDAKVYDGTTTSSTTPTFGTLYGADTVTGLAEAFASKNVLGANTSVLSVTGYSVNDGNGGGNYTVTTQDAPGTITPAALTITATSDTKVYDGSATSSKTPTFGTLYAGDTVTGLTQAFNSKNVLGTSGSELSVTGYTVNDADAGKNYTVTTQTATGTIIPDPLSVRAKSVSTVYGSSLPSLTYTISGFVGGDTLSLVSGEPVFATTGASRRERRHLPDHSRCGDLERDQLHVRRRRSVRRYAHDQARAARDHRGLDQHVHGPAGVAAHGRVQRFRQWRYARQPHVGAGGSLDRQFVKRQAPTRSPPAVPAHPTTRSRTRPALSP